ncbi:BadF/BadG/BcrA/BcrD ATPase family protein [Curtobacterium sp. MCBD17_040]|uniref:N-acetylglucosamine kinase n=1 Tax=Curtobacterium sp. MCBD17_040 TaxID=2175674 RepID=UPI000DA7C3F4|nr:BadF/BadG/BcrA/BcrD ATPase family protein [Curtobacterium sp. MCBD17_040]WIB64674.1 BadF/BadG/BcrA/BcrD ATPase family protein [Curtobacterium sp. MCBD17_040]
MAVFLGVDGGGTKTAFVLLDDDGRELGAVEGASAYHLEHGLPHVRQVLVEGVAAVTAAAGTTADAITYAFIAIPTYGEASHEVAVLDELPAQALGHDRYRCGNDMIAGWAGSLADADGINVVAGTGSLTYGERAGASSRVGGWGELFGDEGSGYWIGLEALFAFARMSDGRLPRTSLHDRVREAVGVETDLDMIDVVLTRWGRSRGRIASLSRLVVEAAQDDDAAATRIVERAVDHLVELVEATKRNLGFGADEPVPVSYSGGVFRAELVRSGFERALRARSDRYDVRSPRFPSDIGAALHAAKLAGQPLGEAALARLSAGRTV